MAFINQVGRYLDQPALVHKVSKWVPPVLLTGAVAYTAYDSY